MAAATRRGRQTEGCELPIDSPSGKESSPDENVQEPSHSDLRLFGRILVISLSVPAAYGLITALFFVGTPLLMRFSARSIQFQAIATAVLLLFVSIPFVAFLLGIKFAPSRKALTAAMLAAVLGLPLYGLGISCPFLPGIELSFATGTVALLSLAALVAMIIVVRRNFI